jgi:hypothetical protein
MLKVRWRLEVKLGGESQESEREITRERKNGREFEFLLFYLNLMSLFKLYLCSVGLIKTPNLHNSLNSSKIN